MKISEIIIGWYKKNGRELPWRNSSDPYSIWISEVILQQTRVVQGWDYYIRFLDRFPDVISLASAHEDEVLKIWQGLGYYSRARNLHAAARQIVEEHDGIFPRELEAIRQLKGVGAYTAAAIASFAFHQPVAAVDGNISRVISRLYAVSEPVNSAKGEKIIQQIAGELLNREDPANHNQAIMELGALVCLPRNPDCRNCPLSGKCEAYARSRVQYFPVKKGKGPVRIRYFTYLIINNGKFIYVHQRTKNDIWRKLYEFPMLETEMPVEDDQLPTTIGEFLDLSSADFQINSVSEQINHQLSHQLIRSRFVTLAIEKEDFKGNLGWKKILPEEVDDYTLPRLLERFLESAPLSGQ